MTSPQPVLHVVRPAAGGIRQHVIELIRRTDAARFRLSLAAPVDFLADLPPGLSLQAATPLDIAARFSPLRDISAAARLSRLIPPRTGMVHAHGLRAALIAAVAHRLAPFPFVFTAHNLVSQTRLTRLAVQFIGRRASHVIAISHAVTEGLIACGVPADKVSVIPNGVDVAHFERTPSSPIPREPKPFVVGCVARLSPEKGVDVLLGAAARLPEMAFLIAGEGPQRTQLHGRATPNVQWLGRVPDTRAVYAAVNVVAVPSRQEGQGIVALEAMAAGVPVVASRVGGLADMLTDGETARMVPPDDPAALAAALTELLGDPGLRARMAARAQALVRERYDVGQMVREVESVYQALTAG